MGSSAITEHDLAATYDPDTGWETVQQYRKATRLRSEHPELARAEIARRVGRPSSAIRGWLAEDKVPPVVKGLRTAREKGWLDSDPSSEQFRALNQLVAWIYSGGGISADTFAPHFSTDDPLTTGVLTHLLRWVGLSYRCREPDTPDRHREVVPEQGASIFGRVLTVLGAPTGVKRNVDQLTLPSYLTSVATHHQRDFLRIHILNRAKQADEGTAGRYVYMPSKTYCEELVELIESVTAGSATVSMQDRVWISADAVRDLAGDQPIRTALATQALHGSLQPPTDRAFASTYRATGSPGGYRHTQLYEQIQDDDRPRTTLADELPISRSTVRSWRGGSKPYAQNGLERARDHGWIDPDPGSETALGLTGLFAWLLARGTLRDSYYPVFGSRSERQRTHFETIADAAGIDYSTFRLDDPNHVPEHRPETDGCILGRVLYALGLARSCDPFSDPLISPYIYHYPAHAQRFVSIWALHYADDCTAQRPTVTVPSRAGAQFPDAFVALLSDTLDWSVQRDSPQELTIADPALDFER